MTNPTERPEERDSLDDMSDPHRCRTRILDLEAEVKELREENAAARKAFEATLRDRDLGHAAHERKLEAEVRERDEKLAELEPYNERLDRRVEQMEEALREAEPYLWNAPLEGALDVHAKVRAALSPSDTEEVMTQTANEPST